MKALHKTSALMMMTMMVIMRHAEGLQLIALALMTCATQDAVTRTNSLSLKMKTAKATVLPSLLQMDCLAAMIMLGKKTYNANTYLVWDSLSFGTYDLI